MTDRVPHPADPGSMIGHVVGGYRIVSLLGQGGSGFVYEAIQESLGRAVALKFLAAGQLVGRTARARFDREVDIQQRLVHPHMVCIYDVGIHGDFPFLAMELVRGPSLRDHIRSDGPLAVPESCRIGTQVAGALLHLHGLEILHRDLKPANVLMGSEGVAKLADFGLSRMDRQTILTETGQMLGTLSYLAPEIVQGLPHTAASDAYALGLVLYEMLTRTLPYGGANVHHWMRVIVTEPPASVGSQGVDVEPKLEEAVMALLAKDPAGRPSIPDVIVVLQNRCRSPSGRHLSGSGWRQRAGPAPHAAAGAGAGGAGSGAGTRPGSGAGTGTRPGVGRPGVGTGTGPGVGTGVGTGIGTGIGTGTGPGLAPGRALPVGRARLLAGALTAVLAVALAAVAIGRAVRWTRPRTGTLDPGLASAGSPPASEWPTPAPATDPADLELRARAGETAAQFELARAFESGRRGPPDLALAATWYARAAGAGHPPSQARLGRFYHRGMGVAKDAREAIRWYEPAARAGLAEAAAGLGRLYLEGDGIPPRPDQARPWLELAARAGLPEALLDLGLLHDEGRGVAADPKTALRWYDEAIGRGSAEAAVRKARLIHAGRGLERDMKQVVEILDATARRGYAPALHELARLYATGDGIEPDPGRALELYRQAADAGHGPSQLALGDTFARGQGVPVDHSRARYWYDRARRNGLEAGQARWADLATDLLTR